MTSTINSCPFGLKNERVRVSSPLGTIHSHIPTEFNMTYTSKFAESQASSGSRLSTNSSTGSSVNVRFVNALNGARSKTLQVAV